MDGTEYSSRFCAPFHDAIEIGEVSKISLVYLRFQNRGPVSSRVSQMISHYSCLGSFCQNRRRKTCRSYYHSTTIGCGASQVTSRNAPFRLENARRSYRSSWPVVVYLVRHQTYQSNAAPRTF